MSCFDGHDGLVDSIENESRRRRNRDIMVGRNNAISMWICFIKWALGVIVPMADGRVEVLFIVRRHEKNDGDFVWVERVAVIGIQRTHWNTYDTLKEFLC